MKSSADYRLTKEIPDAVMPTDSLSVDAESPTGLLLMTTQTGLDGRLTTLALDLEGATRLAKELIAFLRAHPEVRR